MDNRYVWTEPDGIPRCATYKGKPIETKEEYIRAMKEQQEFNNKFIIFHDDFVWGRDDLVWEHGEYEKRVCGYCGQGLPVSGPCSYCGAPR